MESMPSIIIIDRNVLNMMRSTSWRGLKNVNASIVKISAQ